MADDEDLGRIAELARHTALDVSPRGVTPRVEPELEQLLARLGPHDVPAIAARLDAAGSPGEALIWGGALARISTIDAETALDEYAQRLSRDDPWPESFPGRREVLLHLGRT